MNLIAGSKHHLKQAVKIVTNYKGKRRLTVAQEIFDLMHLFTPVVAWDRDDLWYFVSTNDREISRAVFGQGSYEQEVLSHALSLAEKHIRRAPLLQGRVFVDIGANIGTSTIPALKRFGAAGAVSIEPDPQNFKFLRCNLIFNELDAKVHALQLALSDRSGSGTLERADNSGDHRVRLGHGSTGGIFGESTRPTLDISLARFDDIVREIPIELDDIGIVWMDVQGHEGHVLAGAPSLVASETPVAIEYWPYGLRRADGLTMLHELIATNYRTIIDIRASLAGTLLAELPADEVGTLAERFSDVQYTDLLLLS